MDESDLASVINGTVLAIRLLVHQLEVTTSFDRSAYANLLASAVEDAKQTSGFPQKVRRDFLLLENLSQMVRMDPPREPERNWVPKIIEGGLSDPESG